MAGYYELNRDGSSRKHLPHKTIRLGWMQHRISCRRWRHATEMAVTRAGAGIEKLGCDGREQHVLDMWQTSNIHHRFPMLRWGAIRLEQPALSQTNTSSQQVHRLGRPPNASADRVMVGCSRAQVGVEACTGHA